MEPSVGLRSNMKLRRPEKVRDNVKLNTIDRPVKIVLTDQAGFQVSG